MLAKRESNPMASTQIPIVCNVFSEDVLVMPVRGAVTMAAGGAASQAEPGTQCYG